MSEKNVIKFLDDFGLTKRQTEVYIFLAKKGPQTVHTISRGLRMDRPQVYRTLKDLQEKEIVEETLEYPRRYVSVPLENLIESFIKAKKSEISVFENQKASLIVSWKSIKREEPEYSMPKFSTITGKRKVHSRILKTIKESKKEVLMLTTSLGVIEEDLAGVFDEITSLASKRSIQFKILADISPENLETMKQIVEKILIKNLNVECRHVDLSYELFPRFIIKDYEEAVLHIAPDDESPTRSQEEKGLWINDRMFISILKALFDEMWRYGVDTNERILELETGIPMGRTSVIKDPQEAQTKLMNVLDESKEEIITIVSSQSMSKILESDLLRKHSEKGVKCRIMAPIDLDNLEVAQKLSDFCEVKHVAISYITMMVVDKRHLFIFKTPPINELASETLFYLPDVFYTNDLRYLERVNEMMDDTWKRGIDISEISSQQGMKMPTIEVSSSDTVSKVVDKMLENNVNSVLITENKKPIGIINERDLLKELAEARKDPVKTCAKEVMYTPVVTVDTGEPLTNVLKTMQEKEMKRIAIIKKGKLVGMLAEEISQKKPDIPVRLPT